LAAAQRALAIQPGNERALLLGAAAAADLQEWETCMAFARLLVERDRTNHNARFLLGRGLNARDQVEPAIAHLEVARKGLPHAAQVHRAAADAYRRAGRPAAAMKCLEDGLACDRREDLLVNYVAAAIEADEGLTAVQTLEELANTFPQSRFLAPLTQALRGWATTDGPPPVLIEVVRSKGGLGTVGCDACGASIALANKDDLLCAGCGAVRAGPHRAGSGCGLCGADGRIAPQLAAGPIRVSWLCPYCGAGSVTFE
jgi:tetratricopeptide (TPR) repeat protein